MLQLKYFIVVLLLLACSSPNVNAKKTKPQKPKISKFNVVLENGKKAAIQVREKNDVYTFISKSKSLTAAGYGTATVIFDYSKNNQAMILVTGKGKNAVCRYTDFPVSKSDFQDTLNGQKNSDVTFSGTLGLDGRGDAKKKSNVKKWLKKMASVKRLCRKATIIELTTLDPNEDYSFSDNETFIGIDGYLEIVKESNRLPKPIQIKPLLPSGGLSSVGGFGFIQPRGLPGLGSNSVSGGASNGNNGLLGGASVTAIGGGSGGGGSGGASNGVAKASGGTSGDSNTGGKNNGKNKKNKNKKKKNGGKNKVKKD